MEEVKAWMALPANELEFVVLFFDDQKDLHEWVRMEAGHHPNELAC